MYGNCWAGLVVANAPRAASVILIHHFDIVASARNGRRGIAPNPIHFTQGDSRLLPRRSLTLKIGLGIDCLELFGTIANSRLFRQYGRAGTRWRNQEKLTDGAKSV